MSVGDRKSLIIYARPHFPLGDEVWEDFSLLIYDVGGLIVYNEEACT